MNDENLIPIRSKKKARELGKKGGLVKSEAKNFANLLTSSHKAKCRNCNAVCILKTGNLKLDKDFICNVPDARAKSIWFNMPIMNESVLQKIGTEAMFELRNVAEKPKDLKSLLDAVDTKTKTDYPKVSDMNVTNIQVNVWTHEERIKEIKRLLNK